MTKIRNTKKGMAKKTLSISLAVAMLATSNVPVWAAEDLFTDGAAAVETVEAPVEDVFSDAAEEVVEEAPVVEEVVDTPEAFSLDDNIETVNKYGYKEVKLEMGAVDSWETDVTVKGHITDKDGKEITNLKYTWLADGQPAAGVYESSSTTGVAGISYKPVHADFNKKLSVVIYAEGEGEGVIYRTVLAGDTVKALDISDKLTISRGGMGLEDVDANGKLTYNGLAQRPTVTGDITASVYLPDGVTKKTLTKNDFKWHYEMDGEEASTSDLTNVTDKLISVYGTLFGTYDITSPAYGYTANTTKKAGQIGYYISKFVVTKADVSLLKTSLVYTGVKPIFGKKDVKVEIPISATNKVDITTALVDDEKFNGKGSAVGTGYSFVVADKVLSFDMDADILKNFDMGSLKDGTLTYKNTYDITVLDLAQCEATANREFTFAEVETLLKKNSKEEITNFFRDNLTLTVDGMTFSLENLKDDINVSVDSSVVDAIAKREPVTVSNALEISYKVNTQNVTNKTYANINLVTERFGEAYVLPTGKTEDDTNPNWILLPETKAGIKKNTTVPYIGKEYSLTATNGALHGLSLNTVRDKNGVVQTIDRANYSVSYNDNVNAGIVEVTITGKGTWEGATKKVYFKISQHTVKEGDFTSKTSVTVNPANNHEPALYKDALDMKFESVLADNSKATLKEDTDYKVEYYYVDKSVVKADDVNNISVETIKTKTGTNNVGNYVFAVATPVKDGNFVGNALVAGARISEKSISDVTVTVEKDAYTFTGEQISAKVTVKDGTVVLEEGKDYILQYNDNILVGTATVVVVPLTASGYDTTTRAEATFEITPANAADVKVELTAPTGSASTIAVSGKENTFLYTGKQIKPEATKVTLDGVNVTKYFDITYPTYGENVNAGKEAGSITIAPKANDKNFTGTKTQLFNIQGKELNGTMKLYNGDKTEVLTKDAWAYRDDGTTKYGFYYDGTEQKFGEVKFTPEALVNVTEGVDYEVKYFDNVDAGTGFVAIIAKGNYGHCAYGQKKDEVTVIDEVYSVVNGVLYNDETPMAENVVDVKAFKVLPSYFTAKNIKVENGVYAGGKPVKPTVSVEVNGKTLVEGKDYTVKLTSIKGDASPDEFVDATADQPYYARISAKGGYKFDGIYGSSEFIWGIDKKDLAACDVTVTKNGEDFDLKVMNGNVTELKEEFDVVDNGDGTATVSVVDGGKNYTGSATVAIIDPDDKGAVGIVEIADVKVDGNKATVILTGEAENAEGYDYVISTVDDWKNGRVDITKNQLKTTGDFFYVQKGTYYAYCHAYRRDENGVKVFSPEFSKTFKFTVTAITPEKPAITSVTRKGNNVTVTYTTCKDAAGYDVVLGTANRVVNGERRPVDYGTLVKKNLKEGTTSVTFKNVPEGTYYAGLHAFNRSRQDNNNKVFSPWSDIKPITVK